MDLKIVNNMSGLNTCSVMIIVWLNVITSMMYDLCLLGIEFIVHVYRLMLWEG